MKIKQLIALILCISLILITLAGCGNSNTEDVPEDINIVNDTPDTNAVVDEHIHDEECGHQPSIDFDAAIATFPPDTVMMRSDDLEINWAELYVFLFRTVTNIMHSVGMDIDWDEEMYDGITFSDIFLDYATDEAITFLVYMYGIEALNLVLSDSQLREFDDDMNEIIDSYGSKEVLENSLREHGGFYNYDVFENLFKVEFSIGFIIDKLYGEDAVDFPAERIEEYAQEHGYMMAYHILRLKTEDEDDETPLNEINDILSQLEARVGSDDFVDFFKELMVEHSEDHGGLMSFPNGYLFLHSDMVEPFSNACAELEEGELSGVVETVYGYHIILRIPIDFDEVPIANANEGMPRTLRQLAVLEDFDGIRHEWLDALNIEYTPEYESINLAEIFKASFS